MRSGLSPGPLGMSGGHADDEPVGQAVTAPWGSDRPLVPPTPFVGREGELELLVRLLDEAATGRPQTVIMEGQAGVGKTRLALEFAREAESRGWQVLWGTASRIEEGLPFAPVIEAMARRAVDMAPDVRDRMRRDFPLMAAVLPGGAAASALTWKDADARRTLLFEGIRLLIEQVSAAVPVVLVLDDLPEADVMTLEWFHYIVRRTARGRIVLLATARKGPGTPQALAEVVLSLGRLDSVHRLPIARLPAPDIRRLTAGVLGAEPPENVMQFLERRSEGIPFYLIELIRHFLAKGHLRPNEEGWHLEPAAERLVPEGVRDIVAARMASLSEGARGLLLLIGMSGPGTPVEVLREAGGLTSQAFASVLETLIESGLAEETKGTEGPALAIAHPLVRDAVLLDVPETERRLLHQALAEAYRKLDPGNVEAAAFHLIEADATLGDPMELNVFLAAGERFLNRRAFDLAAKAFMMAERLAQHSDDPAVRDGGHRAGILLAETWAQEGRPDEAVARWDRIRSDDVARGDIDSAIRVSRRIIEVERTRSFDSALRRLEEGIALWDGTAPQSDVLWMMGEAVVTLLNAARLDEAKRAEKRLWAYDARFPSPLGRVLATLRAWEIQAVDWTCTYQDDPEDAILHGDLPTDDRWDLDYEYQALRAYRCLNRGHHIEALRRAEKASRLMRAHGHVAEELSCDIISAYALYLAGDWDEVQERCQRIERLARQTSMDGAIVCALDLRAMILHLEGRWTEGRRCLEELAFLTGDVFPADQAGGGRRRIFAGDALASLAREEGFGGQVEVAWANTHGLRVLGEVYGAEVSLRGGDVERAAALAARLRAAAPGGTSYFAALAGRLEGETHFHEGRLVAAAKGLREAADLFEELGMPFPTALCLLYLAKALGSRDESGRGAAQKAQAIFGQLKAIPWKTRAEHLLGRDGGAPETGGQDRGPARPFGLTEREWEVSKLVAEGLTNREIAQRLFVAPRTVATHLEHILQKSGSRSRTVLTGRLHDEGWLDVPPPATPRR